MIYSIFIIFYSFYISNIFYKRFISQSSPRFLDIPNKRSMHIKPIPRGAGIIFILFTTIPSLIYLFIYGYNNIYFIPIAILPLSLTGLFDDLYSLNPLIKYASQFLISIFLINLSNLFLSFPLASFLNLVFYLFIIFLFTGIINFINFMDGIDGLVAGSMIIIFLMCAILISNSYLIFDGSLLAFLT